MSAIGRIPVVVIVVIVVIIVVVVIVVLLRQLRATKVDPGPNPNPNPGRGRGRGRDRGLSPRRGPPVPHRAHLLRPVLAATTHQLNCVVFVKSPPHSYPPIPRRKASTRLTGTLLTTRATPPRASHALVATAHLRLSSTGPPSRPRLPATFSCRRVVTATARASSTACT